MYTFRCRFVVFTLIIAVLSWGMSGEEILKYGIEIDPISSEDIHGQKFTIPFAGQVTFIYFFDSNIPHHLQKLSELDFYLTNLPAINQKIVILGISRDLSDKNSKKLNNFETNIYFIDDSDLSLSTKFKYECGQCIKILLIDAKQKLRLLTSEFNLLFLREVIQRYAEEIS